MVEPCNPALIRIVAAFYHFNGGAWLCLSAYRVLTATVGFPIYLLHEQE